MVKQNGTHWTQNENNQKGMGIMKTIIVYLKSGTVSGDIGTYTRQ